MSEKKAKYEEKRAIVTEFEGVRFAAILPVVETQTRVEGALARLGIGGERRVKGKVIAIVVDDPRLPTDGPIPQSVWEEYWRNFIDQQPKYKLHIAETVTTACAVAVRIEDVEVGTNVTPASIPVSTAQSVSQGKEEKEQ